jgi:hypothetical protein
MLPPRFGILNSSIAESSNYMFEDALNGIWLETIDTILDKMCKQISTICEESKGQKGMVPKLSQITRKR